MRSQALCWQQRSLDGGGSGHKAVHATETSALALRSLTGVGRLQWEKSTDLPISGCVALCLFLHLSEPRCPDVKQGPLAVCCLGPHRVSGEHHTFTSPGEKAQREGGCPRPHS